MPQLTSVGAGMQPKVTAFVTLPRQVGQEVDIRVAKTER